MADCPSCSHAGLKHTLLSDALPAHTCPSCDGLLVSLVAYRRWRETDHAPPKSSQLPNDVSVDDSKDAIACGKCRKLMTKFRISADSPNRIDYCAGCEDVWLDEGEWDLIEALAGSDHLATILTQPWQRRVIVESVEKMKHERLKTLLGSDYDKVMGLNDWLTDHTSRDVILTYLRRKSH